MVTQMTEEGNGGDSLPYIPLMLLHPSVEIPACHPYILQGEVEIWGGDFVVVSSPGRV